MSLKQYLYELLGRLLRLDQMQSVSDLKLGLAAPWAHHAPLWLFTGCLGLIALVAFLYLRYQPTRRGRVRFFLMASRATVLCLLFLILAEPILMLSISSRKRPILWMLFDGTDSMAIADDLPAEQREAAAKATGLAESKSSPADPAARQRPTRMDYLRALVQKKDNNLLEQFDKQFRLQAFVFDSPQSVRSLELTQGNQPTIDGKHVAEQLTTNGKVTALGSALIDLAHRQNKANVSGLVVFSDFNQNAGPPAVAAAKQLGMEVYTVGLGATRAVDASAEVTAEPFVHKDEKTTINVVVKQTGLDGQTAHVRLWAEPLGSVSSAAGDRSLIAEKSVPLSAAAQSVEISYTPTRAGRFNLVAEVDPLPGEAVEDNNRASREITVLEDYLRMMFVEYEPTWEWRFIKEVFYRDRLVGVKGFRTFLYSSDVQVRKQKELFLPTIAPTRNEFFANDLIFLGDMPAAPPTSALPNRFCEMLKEFVGEMGGGLVVLCGPRFGPQQLAATPLADMLPVVVDPAARIRDQEPFALQLTPRAAEYRFMQLGAGASPLELQQAWGNLGLLPWYQPVLHKHPQATVLAEHPTATCSDGKEKQPLIAIRRYGRGEVLYLGFNETFRLRRDIGEEYFRQFWGQVMERLALNHALGEEKRFVVRTDRRHYQVDDRVTLTVDARTADYQPLSENDEVLAGHKLSGQLVLPADRSQAASEQPLSLTQGKAGRFEAHFTASVPGEHRVRVMDPVTGKPVEWTFSVVNTPVERQRPVRDIALQETMAAETQGRSVALQDVESLLDSIHPVAKLETSVEIVSLVNTWLCLVLVVGLLLCEWLTRKWINLP